MKDYLSLLTQEEKFILCEIITGGSFKELFKRNEREFSRIRKGFRAKSLTEQHALSIAKDNVDSPFLAAWINGRVDKWLQEIQENIGKLEEEGSTHEDALAATMLDSVFHQHVNLYLEFAGMASYAETYAKLDARMKEIQSERAWKAEADARMKGMEEERQQLSAQLQAAQRRMDVIKGEYEQKLAAMEQDKSQLASRLTEAQKKIAAVEQDNSQLAIQLTEVQKKMAELEIAPPVLPNGGMAELEQFDDTDATALPTAGSDETVSLCGVVSDYVGRKWLIRYADLSCHGHYHLFYKNKDMPPYYANRDRIFYHDGPSQENFYGLWTWHSVLTEDPSKDRSVSQYKTNLEPIEIVFVSDAHSFDDLVRRLKDGIDDHPHSRRVMLSFYEPRGKYTGILCGTKELRVVNGKSILAEDCQVVPVYEFTGGDMIRLENGLLFYRNAFAGLPSRLYRLLSPLEMVRKIVYSSISWPAYKARGKIRAEYKTFKEFLGAIPVDDIVRRIQDECHFSESDANARLNEFLKKAWQYVEGNSLEDEIIRSAMDASPELQEKAKEMLRADWEAENKTLLADAQKKRDALDAALKTETARLTEEREAYCQIKVEEERLFSILEEKRKLADDVEKAVVERIKKARENAADFIADMAFVSGQPSRSTATSPAAPQVLMKPAASYHVHPALEKLDELEAHHSWTEVVNTVALELGEAGVAEPYRNGLAAFLCAAWMEKQPILLVGPNAMDIVEAFSAAVTAHQYGVLCCESSYAQQTMAQIGTMGESIVVIHNLLASGWMNRLPEILSTKGIFYLATHPYAEDIQVEPQSLYGFMLPLFTEFLVSQKASGNYYGGYFADDFKTYSAPRNVQKNVRGLSQLALSPLVKGQMNRLMTTMRGIYPNLTTDDEFLFAVFPLAYASQDISRLTEAMVDPQASFVISANLKRDLRHVLGDRP